MVKKRTFEEGTKAFIKGLFVNFYAPGSRVECGSGAATLVPIISP
jgi:hypothetical protein